MTRKGAKDDNFSFSSFLRVLPKNLERDLETGSFGRLRQPQDDGKEEEARAKARYFKKWK
jgi:hypothetical protein